MALFNGIARCWFEPRTTTFFAVWIMSLIGLQNNCLVLNQRQFKPII